MKVAYLMSSDKCRTILENMIVPQMEENRHNAVVAGMFFMFDNAFILHKDSDIGKRLHALSEKTGMVLMACDKCAIERQIENDLIPSAGIGCFPNLYPVLESAEIHQVITL